MKLPATPSENSEIINTLREKAEEFAKLMSHAEAALEVRDYAEQRRLLTLRAQIIIDLPETLLNAMENIEDDGLREEIKAIDSWVKAAQRALDDEDDYLLSMLLVPSGYNLDKDDFFMRFVKHLEVQY